MKKVLILLFLLLLLWACDDSYTSEHSNYNISNQEIGSIKEYINNHLIKPIKEGEVHSAIEILGSNTTNKEIYIWVIAQEFYLEGGSQKRTSGVSLPVVLEVRKEENEFQVLNHKTPGEGNEYLTDVEKMFPKEIRERIKDYDTTELTKRLEDQN